MRHGLRLLRALVGTLAIAAAAAGTADAYVYWSVLGSNSNYGKALGRANLDGSGVKHAFVTGATAGFGIVLYGGRIYWANTRTNSIGRANLDGTAANPTFIPNATSGSNTAIPTHLATDGTYLYWTDGTRFIGRAKIDGTGVQPHFIDAGLNSFPQGIAVTGGTIYFSQFAAIEHAPSNGGTPTILAALPGNTIVTDLATRGGYLYATGNDLSLPAPDGEIIRMQLNGTNVTPGFVPNLMFPFGVAVDDQHVYWTDSTPKTIGRATLGSTGVTDVRMDFISEPGGPGGIAVDSNLDPTTPSLLCTPATVAAGKPTSCKVTITDTASSAPASGQVAFSADASTFFSGSASACTLVVPIGGGQPSCTIGVVPLNPGKTTIVGSYPGDAVHYQSQITFTICVGSGGPCKPPVKCVVPKLKGKTLKRAKALLSKAHCKLGKVKRPKQGRNLLVSKQSPQPGATRSAGTHVNVTLAPRRKRKR
jgi:sugar lactone lactonase YvrE